MKTVAIIQARMTSSRFPGKVLQCLDGLPLMDWVVRAAQAAHAVQDVWVAIPEGPANVAIADWCQQHDVPAVSGPEKDVLSRYVTAAYASKADIIVRLTADCPFLDPDIIDHLVATKRLTNADYVSNVYPDRTWPDGLDVEVFSTEELITAAYRAKEPRDREHVTPWIQRYKDIRNMICPLGDLSHLRWTIDYESDLKHLQRLAVYLPEDQPPAWRQVLGVEQQLKNKKAA